MHGANMIVDAKQAKICYAYKNTRPKLLKTNAALCFNKMCKIKQLKLNYIQFKSNGKTLRDRNTISNAIRYRVNQDIKFLHRKEQNLSTQLYRIYLECADQCSSVWQHIQNVTEMKLNQKLDPLIKNLIRN
jgi:hypothetical protein